MNGADIHKYIRRKSCGRPFDRPADRKFALALVIPAFAESESLPRTIYGISENPARLLRDTLVLVVINNPPPADCDPAKFADNLKTAECLAPGKIPSNLNLHFIDAFSPGMEIPRTKGVGMARKIGMDSVLPHLDWDSSPLILSLDADTDVESGYLEAVSDFMWSNPDLAGASIHFEHREGETPAANLAAARYEILMRYYVWGLRYAGSPYAYHSLGSAMAFPARAYVAAGGMKPRNGGEDFYFLQALRKTGQIGNIATTTVRPSSRLSDRVPFGTGPRIREFLDGRAGGELYSPAIFGILRKACGFLAAADKDSLDTEKLLESLPAEMSAFLEKEGLRDVWPRILDNTPENAEKRILAFNTWFDALKTLKFVHFCERLSSGRGKEAKFPATANIEAVETLVSKGGGGESLDLSSEMSLLRDMRRLDPAIFFHLQEPISC